MVSARLMVVSLAVVFASDVEEQLAGISGELQAS